MGNQPAIPIKETDMTRRDYELVADALKDARPDMQAACFDEIDMWKATARSIAKAMKSQNSRFKTQLFLTRAGYPVEDGGSVGIA